MVLTDRAPFLFIERVMNPVELWENAREGTEALPAESV